MLSHIEAYGNTATASVPVLLAQATAAGALRPGMRVALTGVRCGAGLGVGHPGLARRAGGDRRRVSRPLPAERPTRRASPAGPVPGPPAPARRPGPRRRAGGRRPNALRGIRTAGARGSARRW
ncbi:3-oxoacyl-[acyl-carrier-protein] synthase III C-terminal domain-containing protein [Streptomyces cirratus]